MNQTSRDDNTDTVGMIFSDAFSRLCILDHILVSNKTLVFVSKHSVVFYFI